MTAQARETVTKIAAALAWFLVLVGVYLLREAR